MTALVVTALVVTALATPLGSYWRAGANPGQPALAWIVVDLGTLAFHASHLPPELAACRIGDNMTARMSASGTRTARALSVVVVQQIDKTFVADVTASMLTNMRADDFGARPT